MLRTDTGRMEHNIGGAILMFLILSLAMLNAGCVGLSGSAKPGPTTITILNSSTSPVSLTSVMVHWQTNVPGTSQVEYGTTTAYGSRTAVIATLVTDHAYQLDNLTAGTLYHYRLISRDSNNVQAVNFDLTFTISTDTTPPTVTITSPAQNATISGTTMVSATASDNVGVAGVQFKVDNANTGAEVTVAPYTYALNTTTLSNGNHILTATARDAAGNTATSAGVTVSVSNSTAAPSVSITSPTSGTTVAANILVAATASSSRGIAGVQFKVDNTNTGAEITVAPYTYLLDTRTLSNASHTLTATARDTAGSSTTSAGVTVNVNNSASSPTVSITSPTNGAIVSNTITVAATATSSRGIAGVQFKVDGNNSGTERTSAPYTTSLDTTTQPDGAHFLTATARDTGGTQTTSAPVNITVQNTVAGPPVISGIFASPNSQDAFIAWSTDTPSDSQVDFGVSTTYDQSSTLDPSQVTEHSVTITGLTATRLYHFRVKSKDSAGRLSVSNDNTFTTRDSGGGIPPGPGWYQIPNTKLASVCDDTFTLPWHGDQGCTSIIAHWNGGIAETTPTKNRLIVWGGGHSGYYGNEVYALDLNNLTFVKLNNPSPVDNVITCPYQYIDHTPSSRHSYGGLAFLPSTDSMFVYGGSRSNCGSLATDTWTFNLTNRAWTDKNPTVGNPGQDPGVTTDYDPVTRAIFLHDQSLFYQYNPATNTYAQLSGSQSIDYNHTGVIDPVRRLFFLFGYGSAYKIDISGNDPNYRMQAINTTGCGLMVSERSPGLAYDSQQGKIVGWAGGNTVYSFDSATNQCTPVTYSGGPPSPSGLCDGAPYPSGSQQCNGTFGRFRYFPNLGVFAVVNDWQQNAFTLRLTPGTGITISNPEAMNITTTGARIIWTTSVPADSQVEYGTSTSYGTSTPLNASMVTSHSVSLSGLASSTLYHFRAKSKDAGGNLAVSGDFSFVTNSGTGTNPPTVSILAPIPDSTVSSSITVTASASSSIGIAGVQFLLDGSNLGNELTTAPYSIPWDTRGTSDGTHTLAARARDTAGTTATSVGVRVIVSNGSTGGQDFQTRCAAPGVIRCNGFDTAADIAGARGDNKGVVPGSGGIPTGPRPVIDNTVSASGGGSLKFTIPPQSFDFGAFFTNFSADLNTQFGENSEFYIQWRNYVDPGMLRAFAAAPTGYTAWKQVLIGEGDQAVMPRGIPGSCSELEFEVGQTITYQGPTSYHWCGIYEGWYYFNGTNTVLQHVLNCTDAVPTDHGGCWTYTPNEWMTFQIHIKIGTWNTPSSRMELWAMHPNQAAVKIFDTDNKFGPNGLTIVNGVDPSTNPGARYGKIWLLPYMTAKDTNEVYPQTYIWYDELVISRQKISDPR